MQPVETPAAQTGTSAAARPYKNKAAAPVGFEALLAFFGAATGRPDAAPAGQGQASPLEGQAAVDPQGAAAGAAALAAKTAATASQSGAATAGLPPGTAGEAPAPQQAATASLQGGETSQARPAAANVASAVPEGLETAARMPVVVALEARPKAAFALGRSGGESAWLANLAAEAPQPDGRQGAPRAEPHLMRSAGLFTLDEAADQPATLSQQGSAALSAEARLAKLGHALAEEARSPSSTEASSPSNAAQQSAPPPAPPSHGAYAVQQAQLKAMPHTVAVPEQIAVALGKAAEGERDRISIKLHPSELGRIHIKLDLGQDGTVRAVIAADRPETLELLQREARGLERALEQAGLRTESGGLAFDLSGHGRFVPEQGQEETASGTPELSTIPAEEADTILRERRHDGLVNIRA